MPLISLSSLAGYLLEEALASLLKTNGYRLLRDASDDPEALRNAGHGLLVHGRGADHQADALGELLLPSPFSLPVRLFVEGKNRGSKVSLAEVRNAHGTIVDVNEHFSSQTKIINQRARRRFQYKYALFSAKGFRAEAQGYALAHQISLVDLSGPAFLPLVTAVNEAAKSVLRLAEQSQLDSFPLRQVRLALRHALDNVDPVTLTDTASSTADNTDGGLPERELASWAARFTADLNRSSTGEGLLLGFPSAPFILAMRPKSMTDLEAYIALHGQEIDVTISFDTEKGVTGDWAIAPRADPSGFQLSFGLPGALESWLLTTPHEAPLAKQMFMSSIYIFLENRMIRLKFESVRAADVGARLGLATDGGEGTNSSDDTYLRQLLRTHSHETVRDDFPLLTRDLQVSTAQGASNWTISTVRELMRVLDSGNYVQAKLIRAAASQFNGVLPREDVYRLAGFPPDRTLRGLTRPTRRITGELIDRGLLDESAPYPFQAQYGMGVLATHFNVPSIVVQALREIGPPTGV